MLSLAGEQFPVSVNSWPLWESLSPKLVRDYCHQYVKLYSVKLLDILSVSTDGIPSVTRQITE